MKSVGALTDVDLIKLRHCEKKHVSKWMALERLIMCAMFCILIYHRCEIRFISNM